MRNYISHDSVQNNQSRTRRSIRVPYKLLRNESLKENSVSASLLRQTIIGIKFDQAKHNVGRLNQILAFYLTEQQVGWKLIKKCDNQQQSREKWTLSVAKTAAKWPNESPRGLQSVTAFLCSDPFVLTKSYKQQVKGKYGFLHHKT